MKLSIGFGKHAIVVELTRSSETFALQAKRLEFKQQRRILRSQTSKAQNSYTYCTFGSPYSVDVPTLIQPIQGTEAEAIERASNLTGQPRELIERIWNEIAQYYRDKNSPHT